ncbi:MAG: phosphate acyltransferase PlsX [Mycobacteriales bacterium]
MTRIALDLMGGDHAPACVVEGALLVAEETPELAIVLVGPPDVAERTLAERGHPGRFEVVAATEVITMDEDPARAVRKKRDATVRVCARLVRDGDADAMVSAGSTGAALAAALLTLGRLPGISRPPLAAVVPAKNGPLIFLDAGANPEASVELLAQYALAGSAFATVRLGIAEPRVGLLTNGEEAGKGDQVRKAAYDLLAGLPINFVGSVEGRDVPLGGVADVIVTDGFTGNVLVKGLEGAASMLTELLIMAMTSTPERKAAAKELLPAFSEATAHMSPDELGGAVLLGVNGVCVVGHGAASPRAVASCVRVAVQAVREGLVPKVTAALTDLAAVSA